MENTYLIAVEQLYPDISKQIKLLGTFHPILSLMPASSN